LPPVQGRELWVAALGDENVVRLDVAVQDPAACATANPSATPTSMSTIRDPHAISRFQQEALTASSLNHPHILTVFENLIATSRFSRVSRARYTSPMPP
jgi:hypothetical protein